MLKHWFFNQKINTIIVLALIATLLLTIMLSAFLLFSMQHKEYQNILKNDHQNTASLLAASLQFPLSHGSAKMTEEVIDAFLMDERVVGITVWNTKDAHPLYHTLVPKRVKGTIQTLTLPIMVDGKRAGEVSLKFSSVFIDKELRELFWANTTYFFMQFLVSLLLLLLVFYFKITKPLQQLMSFVHAIGDYPINGRQLWPYEDEISKIGRAFEKAKHTISTVSMRDPQTGIYNHYMLTKLLQNLFAQARQTKTPLALILIEVTNFKQVNEHHGHLKGDALLLGITQDIARLKKPEYYLGRWGGSTLMLLCPHENCSSVEPFAGALHHHFERTLYAGKMSASCAFGIAHLLLEDESVEELVRRANLAIKKARTSQYSPIITEL